MKRAWILGTLLLTHAAIAADKPKPSGPLKAFKGPEGEKVVMVEANDSKQMLVHLKNAGGEWDGQTRLYDVHDMGDGRKDVFYMKKRGSKQVQHNVLVQRQGRWEFYNHPRNQNFALTYSEEESGKISVEEVLKAYKP